MLFYVYEYQHSFVTTLERLSELVGDAGFEMKRGARFLTTHGFSHSFWKRALDRAVANGVLFFARSPLVSAIGRSMLGTGLMFRIHKNLYDHVAVVAVK